MKSIFLHKLNPPEFLLAFKNLQFFYLDTNLCARASNKHKKTSLSDTIILLKIEIPCDKYFLCSKVLCSKVKFTVVCYSKL